MTAQVAWPVGLALLGAVIGSFIATLVIRWPERRSVAAGRSACDGCGGTLGPVELVPLLSALVQRGRCRTCGAAIDPRHWRVELGCAGVGALAGVAVQGPAALAGAVFGWLLLALAALDVAELWLPDALTLPLAAMGIATGLAGVAPPLGDRLIGGLVGFGGLELIRRSYRALRGREGLGGGDPKLFGAIGLWLGWRWLPIVLLVSSGVGLVVMALAAARGRTVTRATPVPFGALLAVAAYSCWLAMIGMGG